MSERVLVTGASGFLGSHICEAAKSRGYDVYALIRPESSARWLGEGLNVIRAELSDKDKISSYLEGIDYVIHNAGVLATTSRNERDSRRTNLELTKKLAVECINKGVKRFVFVSSLAAGGPGSGPEARTETDPDRPVSHYGRSKLEAERTLSSLSKSLFTISLRYSMIYGPRDRNILGFFKAASGRTIPLMGYKPIYTSMVYVKDAANAALSALSAEVEPGGVYQITDGERYTLDLLYDCIEEVLGKEKKGRRRKIPFWLVSLAAWWNHDIANARGISPDQVRQFRALYWYASAEKARRELGWKPGFRLKEGLRATVDWYKEHGWL